MIIVGMLRVKNEARWITEVLLALRPLCDRIVVMDDGSTDHTLHLAAAVRAKVFASPFRGQPSDEARDKNYLLQHVQTLDPDYVISIDGDEVLIGSADKIRAALKPGIANFVLPIDWAWNDRQTIRVDGVYGRYQRPSMFALKGQPALQFRSTKHARNFHCGNVPAGLLGDAALLPGRLLHLGYMHQADRLRKYEWYTRVDPGNVEEDEYKHMVVGDIFPAGSRFKHGGPLRLVTR